MKHLLPPMLGFILVAGVSSCDTSTSPTTAEQQLEAATPLVTAEPEEVATEAVSPSSAYSRKLRGVFMHSVTCTPARLRLGDSIDVEITDAWLERQWEPKSGGLFGPAKSDFSRGYALDSTTDTPRAQLVLAFAPTSRLGHLETGGWRINLSTDTYKEHGFDRSRGNQLIMYFSRSNAVFPLKFNLYTDPKPCPDCQPRVRATFTISE